MGKRDKKDKKKKRRKEKDEKRDEKRKHRKKPEEIAEPVSDEDDSGAESPSQLLLKRSQGSDNEYYGPSEAFYGPLEAEDTSEEKKKKIKKRIYSRRSSGTDTSEPRRKRRRSSSSRSKSSSRSRSRSRSSRSPRSRSCSLSNDRHSSSVSRSPSPSQKRRGDRGERMSNEERKRQEALRKRVYQRDPEEAKPGRKKKKKNKNRFNGGDGKRGGRFDRSRKVWGLDDDINADVRGRSRSVSSERRRRRERNRSGSSDYSRSPVARKPAYVDDVRDENGRIDKKKVLEIAKRNAAAQVGQFDNLIAMGGALAPEIAKLKSQSADAILNLVQKAKEAKQQQQQDVPPASTSDAATGQVEPTPVSSDEEEKEERFKRMTEKRKAAMKGHEEEDMPIVAKKAFEVKKPLIGLAGIKINIANANSLPTRTAQERIQEEAKLRLKAAKAAAAAVPNPLQEWIPVVKEKEPVLAKKLTLPPPPALPPVDSFGPFLPPPPIPPSIDLLLPPPPVPPSFDLGGPSGALDPPSFLPPPPLPPTEINML
ncbi:hypothetical protein L596_008684 [Steinernema carpocapsae]|uniref:Uncharacterized protein n=1 Tax=Steinernema carpocapsae TaxID=34508 RepID=A0A4U5PDI6_STECR|nr:hypothetical protein L596_008684 [Steinernema carpocapsae]